MVQNLIYNLCESFIKNIDGIASITKNTPPLEEILAPATFEITANYADGYYWTTFYTSMANYLAPDGVLVLKVNFNGSQFIRLDVEDGIINKRQGVVLRSSTSSITLTKTYSKSSDDYSDNSLIGTDYLITNPGNAYGLNYGLSHGLSFYRLSSTGRIKANKAYLIMPITYLTQWKIVGNSEVHTLPYPDIPQGYTKCKYLEAHGTEYIELPIGFDNTDEIELTVSFTQINLSNKYAIVPKTWNANNNKFGLGMHTTGVGDVFCAAYGPTGGMAFDTPIVAQDTNVHLFTYANYLFELDNSSKVTVSRITFGGTTNNLKLFYGYNSPTKCRIYTYHQVKANNIEINLIPCLDDNDTPCLYDTISGTTYYNDGTGTFDYEIEPQPTEIWSCGEYNATDGKYHILVQPQGGSVADIALDEPLRKVNDVADTIEFPSGTDGKALVTRPLKSVIIGNIIPEQRTTNAPDKYRFQVASDAKPLPNSDTIGNILCTKYSTIKGYDNYRCSTGIAGFNTNTIIIYDNAHNTTVEDFVAANVDTEFIYELATPTTELVDVPQIQEADSYTCVISQGAKVVEWSSFETK